MQTTRPDGRRCAAVEGNDARQDCTRLVSNSAPTWSCRCWFTACHFQFGKSLGRNAIRIEPNYKITQLKMSPIGNEPCVGKVSSDSRSGARVVWRCDPVCSDEVCHAMRCCKAAAGMQTQRRMPLQTHMICCCEPCTVGWEGP